MNNKIIIGLVATGVIIGGIVVATKSQQSTDGKVLRIATQNNISTLDPNYADEIGANWAEVQTLEGLYTTGKNGEIVAGVAQKVVKPTENNTIYTLHLRKNAKWSDGTKVTAQDFVSSVKRQVDPKTKSTRANHFKDIAGYDAVYNHHANLDQLGIQAVDQYTVKIQLSHPVPYFDFILANQLYPINRAKVKEYGKKYGQTAATTVSNGAYTIKKWNQASTTWEFAKNKYYSDSKDVHYDTIKATQVTDTTLAAKQFQTKKVDEATVSGSVLSNLKKTNADDIKATAAGRVAFIVWNANDKVASNSNLKKAVSLAINRQTLADEALGDGSKPAKSIIPSGEIKIAGKDLNDGLSLPYNKIQAQQYLKKAQLELGQKKIDMTLNTADTDAYKAVGVFLKQSIESALPDVTINLNRLPLNAEISAFNNHNFQAGTLSWSTDYDDPIDFLDIAYSKGAINFTKWKNDAYDKVYEQINSQNTANDARYQLEREAAKINNEENGVTPLYQTSNVHLQSKTVKNLNYPLVGYQNYKYAK
ncbi:peptide ABC transporter substrate-binding protein [Leuconostoc gelidum subsp. gasicomitatum]|uniref:peptide ABC transporter substrate-binding protein n=1 Tax=Leuconostoc gasicomitatum TaxID=115778 RepID=UPI001CC5C182|nr:peptide ABC transporter substrate-binding protein [Leuconostoc gasicomitatum]MBZ5957040.1 peptide ABC transporter substrate-binding protein [Leuconostoc gasicomitatum]